ncbi:hypothetical protein HJFPF1_02746 [Paramyrothecium foliicola]|nr:hypothetical protein HJFPF1_02746 [Paramyrothecium foliicola]
MIAPVNTFEDLSEWEDYETDGSMINGYDEGEAPTDEEDGSANQEMQLVHQGAGELRRWPGPIDLVTLYGDDPKRSNSVIEEIASISKDTDLEQFLSQAQGFWGAGWVTPALGQYQAVRNQSAILLFFSAQKRQRL